MSQKILVTDTLFIFDEHIKKLEAAGFEVERLDKMEATEDELCEAVKDKAGYILGGIEHVTEKVIDSANELKCIAFTGADFGHYIDAWQPALDKGIAITSTPGATTDAVSEAALTLMLLMIRDLPELSRIGDKSFKTVRGMQDLQFGIAGLGHIGSRIVEYLNALGAKRIVYWDRNRKVESEKKFGIEHVSLEELFKTSDVITNHVSTNAGQLFTAELIKSTKDDVLFINTGGENNFDYDAVQEKLSSSAARIALDVPKVPSQIHDFPAEKVFYTNKNTGFNTVHGLKTMSDMATVDDQLAYDRQRSIPGQIVTNKNSTVI